MGLSVRGDLSYGLGFSISRIYYDVGYFWVIMELFIFFEFSLEFRKVMVKFIYCLFIDFFGQVYIDIVRFLDNFMQVLLNFFSFSSGFRGYILDLLIILLFLDKSMFKEILILYIEKKIIDVVSFFNFLEFFKMEKLIEFKNIILEGMVFMEIGFKFK